MKKFWIIIIVLLALIGGVIALITFVCEDDWCFVFPWQKAVIAIPADWKDYSSDSIGFSMKYDPSLTLVENSTTETHFYKWGPTQRGETEVYDGMSLSVRRVAATSGIDSYASSQIERLKEVGTITTPLHGAKINGIAVKQYSISALGDFTIILVPVDRGTILEVAYMAPDPTGAGFQQVIDKMLSTFQLVR